MATGTGSPCGACKFLRRKCAADCIFAPYFCTEQGPAQFAAIHKVFGASNVSKLLLHVPVAERCEAVVTIAYEAQARIRDPVYGCVAHIFALQQQVASLQAQLMQAKAQMAQNLIDSGNVDQNQNQWPSGNMVGVGIPSNFHQANYPAAATYMNISSLSLQNSLDQYSIMDQSSTDHGVVMASRMRGILQNDRSDDDDQLSFQPYNYSKKRPASQTDLSELQALALRMTRD
ncbi:LOB domain-containing protein 16-like [Rhododendron vialii]|uniref:LOB domain-containing protein 16-like n=1 Tax=Rhododendron vialii TaxID=182163 RepID=UPI00265FBFEB|nr:LOB domain-containing protein 16-like [Rhododendron vialii]